MSVAQQQISPESVNVKILFYVFFLMFSVFLTMNRNCFFKMGKDCMKMGHRNKYNSVEQRASRTMKGQPPVPQKDYLKVLLYIQPEVKAAGYWAKENRDFYSNSQYLKARWYFVVSEDNCKSQWKLHSETGLGLVSELSHVWSSQIVTQEVVTGPCVGFFRHRSHGPCAFPDNTAPSC